jgi:CelD/BcsL family acetyltransferase involved in cellulose biosynthesis
VKQRHEDPGPARVAAAERPKKEPGETIHVLRSREQLAGLAPAWERLFARSETRNPFAHPAWMLSWLDHFAAGTELYVVTVEVGGELAGVAPFVVRSVGPRARRLMLFGTGPNSAITELPQVLIAAGLERRVMKSIMRHLTENPGVWDWVELSLPPEQGWFELEWLPSSGPGQGAFVLHSGTSVCVVRELPSTEAELGAALKPSARELVRRSVNRLRRDGHTWHVEVVRDDPARLREAMECLLRLHAARAAFRQRARRDDYGEDPKMRAFLLDASDRLFEAGHYNVALLHVDGVPVAGVMLLRGHRSSFLSVTGFLPEWWRYSPVVLLTHECLLDAVRVGDTHVNFSVGPTVAKLRWSEAIEQHNTFTVVGPRARSRRYYAAYGCWRSLLSVRAARTSATNSAQLP